MDSKQIGRFENLGKYNRHYVKVKDAHLLEEISMSFKLCMVSRNTLHTLPPGVPAGKEIYKVIRQIFKEFSNSYFHKKDVPMYLN